MQRKTYANLHEGMSILIRSYRLESRSNSGPPTTGPAPSTTLRGLDALHDRIRFYVSRHSDPHFLLRQAALPACCLLKLKGGKHLNYLYRTGAEKGRGQEEEENGGLCRGGELSSASASFSFPWMRDTRLHDGEAIRRGRQVSTPVSSGTLAERERQAQVVRGTDHGAPGPSPREPRGIALSRAKAGSAMMKISSAFTVYKSKRVCNKRYQSLDVCSCV